MKKEPIMPTVEILSSIISAMLIERGESSYTLSLKKFEELGLGNRGTQYEGVVSDDPDQFSALVVTLIEA